MNPNFLHGHEPLHCGRLQRHEIAETYVPPAEQMKQRLVRDVEALKSERFHATSALGHHQVDIGRGERLQQFGYGRGDVLAIGVHDNASGLRHLLGGIVESDRNRALVADIPSQADNDTL